MYQIVDYDLAKIQYKLYVRGWTPIKPRLRQGELVPWQEGSEKPPTRVWAGYYNDLLFAYCLY